MMAISLSVLALPFPSFQWIFCSRYCTASLGETFSRLARYVLHPHYRFSRANEYMSIVQTSRRLHDISQTPTIWLYALNTMIRHYHLPPNTFAESEFSLRKLQSILIGPSRFRIHCINAKGDAQYIRTAHAGFNDVRVLAMVPGGRWVLTGHFNGHLNVWDTHGGMKSRQVVDLRGPIHVMLVQRTDDCLGVRVLTESTDPDNPCAAAFALLSYG